MTTRNERITRPNYTQTPNIVLDAVSEMSEAEMKVMLVLSRRTFGFHRETAELSTTDFQKATGLSRASVTTGIQKLMELGWIGRKSAGQSFRYFIILDDIIPAPATDEKPPEPDLEEITNPFAEEEKQAKTELNAKLKTATEFWVADYQTDLGQKYVHGGAKDAKGAKKLLAVIGVDEFRTTARAAWKRSDLFNCKQALTICGFAARYNDIRRELGMITPPASGPNSKTITPPVKSGEERF